MIGRVFTDGRAAVLNDNGQWSAEDAVLAGQLNALYAVREYSPADGVFGLRELHRAAQALGWQVEVAEKEPAPADAVF